MLLSRDAEHFVSFWCFCIRIGLADIYIICLIYKETTVSQHTDISLLLLVPRHLYAFSYSFYFPRRCSTPGTAGNQRARTGSRRRPASDVTPDGPGNACFTKRYQLLQHPPSPTSSPNGALMTEPGPCGELGGPSDLQQTLAWPRPSAADNAVLATPSPGAVFLRLSVFSLAQRPARLTSQAVVGHPPPARKSRRK